MSHPELMIPQTLIDEFKNCNQIQFSGKLDIKTGKEQIWTFYYRLGRIVWATGGAHPIRRWRRNMIQHCPQINLEQIKFSTADLKIDHWDYRLLTDLHQQEQIKREQLSAVAENTIAELLFDLAQQTALASQESDEQEPISAQRYPDIILATPVSLTRADLSLKQMQESWSKWSDVGLANYSPNLAPAICDQERLQQHVSPIVYKNFAALLNGKYTLRALAIKLKQDILLLTRSLLPYIQKNIIELVEISDLPLTATQPVKSNNSNAIAPKPPARTPLIACIDDSLQTCQMLEQIFTSRGLQYMHIHDSIQALPMLLERKPRLIFLDLVMPVANGYEICVQLRRMSVFANTPIIILTGSDGLVDRVRAKVVGATDFLSKPVDENKVLAMVRKYLYPTSSPLNLSPSPVGSQSS